MAHESFEDAEVAELLNRDFVSVKVDREERPDVDAVYMSVEAGPKPAPASRRADRGSPEAGAAVKRQGTGERADPSGISPPPPAV